MSEKTNKYMPYPEEQKEALIKRMLPPENKSIAELSRETGINGSTLNNWKRKAQKNAGLTENNNKNFSSQQKFLIVIETYTMNEAELAAYCRSNGL
ncbi:transposase [Inediibacterium massiliense]|uniref:transposase n=1 Tax=Inediibacterium massiliense TaxID=1658111 RepID=UPI0006B55568|nr:transposase [Inediibacterium massiliense]